MKALPDTNRIEKIKKDVDRLFFVGIGIFVAFLIFPYVEIERMKELNGWKMYFAIIAILTPSALFLYWVEEKINNRRIWWSIGSIAWTGVFYLALAGHHLN